jgi:hypothetical protein
MFSQAVMAEPWDGVGEAATAEPIRHKRGLLGVCDTVTPRVSNPHDYVNHMFKRP